MRRHLPLAAFCALLFAACERAPTQLPAVAPRLDFTNGPSDVGNVERLQSGVRLAVRDPVTDLIVVAGFPTNIADFVRCGGTQLFQIMDIQTVGQNRDVLQFLIIGSDVHLVVYQQSTFASPCTATPLAEGTGRAMATDNDVGASLTRGDAFGVHITGTLADLVNGGQVHLNAIARWVILPDGTFRQLVNTVSLAPAGP